MVKAGNGGLQLLIENTAVCNNDYAVKNCIVVFVVEAGHTVSRPSDRIGLAGTGTVLDQITLADALGLDIGQQSANDGPLVIARENQALAFVLQANGVFFFDDLQMHEARENFQQVVRQQHLIPQVAGGVVVGIFRDVVPCAAVTGAFVKRQEEGFIALKFGRHKHFVLADGKVHQRPAFKGQQRFGFVGERIFR